MKVCLDVNFDGVSARIAKANNTVTGMATDDVPKVEPKLVIRGGSYYVRGDLIYRQVVNGYAKFMMINTGAIDPDGHYWVGDAPDGEPFKDPFSDKWYIRLHGRTNEIAKPDYEAVLALLPTLTLTHFDGQKADLCNGKWENPEANGIYLNTNFTDLDLAQVVLGKPLREHLGRVYVSLNGGSPILLYTLSPVMNGTLAGTSYTLCYHYRGVDGYTPVATREMVVSHECA